MRVQLLPLIPSGREVKRSWWTRISGFSRSSQAGLHEDADSRSRSSVSPGVVALECHSPVLSREAGLTDSPAAVSGGLTSPLSLPQESISVSFTFLQPHTAPADFEALFERLPRVFSAECLSQGSCRGIEFSIVSRLRDGNFRRDRLVWRNSSRSGEGLGRESIFEFYVATPSAQESD